MSRPDFDVEFGVTPFNGLRAFQVDAHGRLRGINYDAVIPPGTIEAKCGHSDRTILERYGPHEERRAEDIRRHMQGCNCGFYSYYLHDNALSYMNNGTIAAVVENSGFIVNGTKGMRSTKMKVVALAHHTGFERYTRRPKGSVAPLMRFNHWAEDVGDVAVPVGIFGFLVTLVLGFLAMRGTIGPQWLLFYLMTLPLVLTMVAAIAHDPHGRKCPKCRDVKKQEKGHFTEPQFRRPVAERMDRLAANYPGVPIYKSVTEMLKKHPVDVYQAPPPPTPDTTDGFWEDRDL